MRHWTFGLRCGSGQTEHYCSKTGSHRQEVNKPKSLSVEQRSLAVLRLVKVERHTCPRTAVGGEDASPTGIDDQLHNIRITNALEG